MTTASATLDTTTTTATTTTTTYVSDSGAVEDAAAHLLPDETLIAAYRSEGVKGGFIALTDRRVICAAKAWGQPFVSVVTLPYRSVVSVSCTQPKVFRGPSGWGDELFIVVQGGGVLSFKPKMFLRGSKAASSSEAVSTVLNYVAWKISQ